MKKSKKMIYLSIPLLALMVYPITMFNCKKIEHFKLSRFISPETCGGCHSEIYEQWRNSMHNLAHEDPVYRKIAVYLIKGLTDKDELKEAESCVKCHTPIGVVSGNPTKTSDDLDNVPEIAKKGIQCDYCHSATGAYRMYNNGITLKPGHGEGSPGTKRGPFKDSKPDFHKAEFSEFHTSARICGTCHDVKHLVYGTKLESTYDEWLNGPYNSDNTEKMVVCQGCHMYHRPDVPATGSTPRPENPGKASDGGPDREHIFTHYFVGGNSYIPAQFGDKLKANMATARLKNAAELSIDGSRIKKNKLIITVKNTGAGHYLPTGLTDIRQMWLEITIKNDRGRQIYSSGKLSRDNYITNGTIIYNTVFGDGKGNRVVNISKAKEILKDRRIPPGESLKETIKIPDGKWKTITAEVKLLYRSAPQKIVDAVFGKGKVRLPVTTMEEIRMKISK